MKKIALALLVAVSLMVGCGLVMPQRSVSAVELCDDPKIDPALKDAAGCPEEAKDRDKTIMEPVVIGIRVVLSLLGIVAVVVIVVGGIMYTISTGDAAKVTKAKNTIIYGIVGMVVALLAFAIVEFVSKSIFG